MTKAHYKCLKCKKEWQTDKKAPPEGCPFCAHMYMKWLNYPLFEAKVEEHFKARGVKYVGKS